jgi:hypothetical protein
LFRVRILHLRIYELEFSCFAFSLFCRPITIPANGFRLGDVADF